MGKKFQKAEFCEIGVSLSDRRDYEADLRGCAVCSIVIVL